MYKFLSISRLSKWFNMFGSYANTEDDDFSASGSFNLASLAGSKNYRRRLGNVTGGTASLPVCI